METRDSISRLRQQLRGDVGQLLSDVRALRDEQQEFTQSITERVDGVNETVQTLNTNSDVTNTSHSPISTLQSALNSLTSRLNTPMDLYQGCIQVTRSCRMSTFGSGNYYWRSCNTRPSLHIDPAVSLYGLIAKPDSKYCACVGGGGGGGGRKTHKRFT